MDGEGRHAAPDHKEAPTIEMRLEAAVRAFVARLPTNHGASLCLEELFSLLRHIRELHLRRPSPPGGPPGSILAVDSKGAPVASTTDDSKGVPVASAMDDSKGVPVASAVDDSKGVPVAGSPVSVEDCVVAGWGVREWVLEGAIRFCEHPAFASFLAAFGRLPDHPYLLVFDPNAYQTASDGAAANANADTLHKQFKIDRTASITLPTPDLTEEATVGARKAEHLVELEKQDAMLVRVFNEEHRPTGTKCSNCGEDRFLSITNFQKRAADEGGSTLVNCGRCGEITQYA